MFMGLLISIVNTSNHTKWVLLSNQKCMIQPTLINLHPIEYSQGFHYYPFVVKLDRCAGRCNTLNDLSNLFKCVQHNYRNKWIENIIKAYNHANVHVDLMEENVINGGIMIDVNVSVKNVMYVKKIVSNPATCNCENGNCLLMLHWLRVMKL